MTSGSQSKAQRRADGQRRAAEKRAAELRQKRMKIGLRVGGAVVGVGIIVLIVVLITGGSSAPPASSDNPGIALQAIPASLKLAPYPSTTTGPEGIPIPSGPKLATLVNGASGSTVDGIQCQTNEQTVTHVHTHLTLIVNGKAQLIPYGIGIPGAVATSTPQGPYVGTGSCFYWLHAHAEDGIIHIESPSLSEHFTLGQFFAEWGIPLSSTQVGSATGKVTVFFTSPGKKAMIYTGNPANLPLGHHYQIQLEVGTPLVAPENLKTWAQL